MASSPTFISDLSSVTEFSLSYSSPKLYHLSKIMHKKTDDQHGLTMLEIQKYLEEYGVTADRKSLYDDLESLKVLGYDIIGEKDGRQYHYRVGKKQFEIAELKLLVDAVQSSKFITEKKSRDLIKTQLLIFDEATSNLDSITENAIKESIFNASRDVSCIMIVHRLSTIRQCDKIYVMDKGTVAESGSHEELMDKKGLYYNMWISLRT